MDTASVAHPCALSDIEATAPYKENCCVYLFSLERPLYSLFINKHRFASVMYYLMGAAED